MMSTEELSRVDDWRFQNRVATRSDAVRRLCQMGLIASSKVEKLLKQSSMRLDEDIRQSEKIIDLIRENGLDYSAIGKMYLENDRSRSNKMHLEADIHLVVQELSVLFAELNRDGSFNEIQSNLEKIRSEVHEKAALAKKLIEEMQKDQ